MNGTSLVIGISKMVLPRSGETASKARPGATNAGFARNRSIWARAAASWAAVPVSGPRSAFPADPHPAAIAPRTTASAAHAIARLDREIARGGLEAAGTWDDTCLSDQIARTGSRHRAVAPAEGTGPPPT